MNHTRWPWLTSASLYSFVTAIKRRCLIWPSPAAILRAIWVGGDQLAITVNDVAEIVERLAWLHRDKLRQSIAENRAKAQARQTRWPTLLA